MFPEDEMAKRSKQSTAVKEWMTMSTLTLPLLRWGAITV
jgi:hypothetical protein